MPPVPPLLAPRASQSQEVTFPLTSPNSHHWSWLHTNLWAGPKLQTMASSFAFSSSHGPCMLAKPALCHSGWIRLEGNKMLISKAYGKIKFTWWTDAMGTLESTLPAQWEWWKFTELCQKSLKIRPIIQALGIRITLFLMIPVVQNSPWWQHKLYRKWSRLFQWYSRQAWLLSVATPPDFCSLNIFLETCAIALNGISVGMHFIKDILRSVLRKARVRQASRKHHELHTMRDAIVIASRKSWLTPPSTNLGICETILQCFTWKNKILPPYYLVVRAEDKPVNRFLWNVSINALMVSSKMRESGCLCICAMYINTRKLI